MIITSVSRRHLVLRPYVFTKHVLLEINSVESQLFFTRHLSAKSIQSMRQTNGESRTRAHATARGQIAIVVNFKASFLFEKTQDFPYRGMKYIINLHHILDLGIDNAIARFEKRRQI